MILVPPCFVTQKTQTVINKVSQMRVFAERKDVPQIDSLLLYLSTNRATSFTVRMHCIITMTSFLVCK